MRLLTALVALIALALGSPAISQDGCPGLVLDFPSCMSDSTWTPPNQSALVQYHKKFDVDSGTQETWPDDSGLSNDLSQATAGKRPTTTGSAPHPSGTGYGLLFDAVDDEMPTGGANMTLTKRAFAMSWNITWPGAGNAYITGGVTGARQSVFYQSASNRILWWSSNNQYSPSISSPPDGNNCILIYEDFDADTLDVWLNRSKVVTATNWTGTPIDQTFAIENAGSPGAAKTIWYVMGWESSTALSWSAPDLDSLFDEICGPD